MKTCGQLGHVNLQGEPCKQPQGFGVRSGKGKRSEQRVVHEGPCKYHDEASTTAMQLVKKSIVKLLELPELTLVEIGKQVKTDPATIWRWRQEDEEFDKLCISAQNRADEQRVKKVEESLYRRACGDKLNPIETIFFLKNRAPSRWRDKRELEATGKDGVPLFPVESLRDILASE